MNQNFINPIYYGDEGIKEINKYILSNKPSKIVFLVDENTHELCYPKIITEIESPAEIEILEIESGENNKNLYTCLNLWEALTELKIDRKALFINVGGGVLTDMGGFIANCYKRGIHFINIPTTLLAMVDASIGGKTGVDLGSHKNQIGNFVLPQLVHVDVGFLSTLSKEQILSGFAEIIKHGLIADKEYWRKIIQIDEITPENLESLIKISIEIKKAIVTNDFTETGVRKILNFGHTVGHAVESFFLENNSPILHGEGVAMGIIVESYISMKKGLLSYSEHEEIKPYIFSLFPKLNLKKEYFDDIFLFMQNDKKNINNEIKFVLLEKIGRAVYDISVEKELIKEAIYLYIDHKK
ncbi:3-dehydroquinate synthase [Apibacter mensalis]|jgi:3-dehydroquinate synthase|uniref:3-dehydroquinate synthase n=1 Tax=Apibacter mensalis TaxID=1586267 RepID=A0A0X3AR17_9FLAO|nr:3-dehydroquinate synthase [Apibacter mensalis]CVK16784.1 3-dehydroquinate synthase [Apibacter mensalis]